VWVAFFPVMLALWAWRRPDPRTRAAGLAASGVAAIVWIAAAVSGGGQPAPQPFAGGLTTQGALPESNAAPTTAPAATTTAPPPSQRSGTPTAGTAPKRPEWHWPAWWLSLRVAALRISHENHS
jgi:hypothetical protein